MNEENKCNLSVQHILVVIIGAIGSVQPLTVIQIKLQPFVCTLAVIRLQIFAVCNWEVKECSTLGKPCI